MKQSKRKKQSLYWLGAVVASTMLMAPTVFAQEQEDFSLEQMVVTANRVPTKVSEAAANVTVITREEIERGNYTSLTDVLKHANGVVVSQQGFPGGEEYIWLNGDERVVILVDGRRVNLGKLAGHTRSTYDLNSFPAIGNIERIEIVKGAASALYGSDAVGGVINIITRKGEKVQSSVKLGTGSWGMRTYDFTTEGSTNDWNWFLSGGKREQDYYSYKDFKTGTVKEMPNSAYDQQHLTFRLDKQLTDNTSLTLSVEHADDHKGQPAGAPGVYPYYNASAYLDTLTNTWDLTYHMKKNAEIPAYLRVYQNYYKYSMQASSSDGMYNNKELGFAWQDGWRLDDRNLLTGGAEWRNVKVQYPGFYDNEKLTNKAIYMEDRVQMDDKWVFTPGVRYDHYNMFGSKTTPRASLNYQMDKNTDMYLSWGKVFNAPTTDDLYWPSQYGGYMVGNPNLKPEAGYTTTLGINKKLDTKTTLKASYFQSKLKDAIDWDNATGVWTPSNVNEAKKQGADLELRRTLSPAWTVKTGYSYLKVEKKQQVDSSYTLDSDNAQPNGYRLGISYTQDKWSVDLDGTGASGRSTEKFTSSRYWIMDLSVNYSIDNNTRAYFKGKNLTNRTYELYGSSYLGAYPMEARNYQFGINYSF